MKMQKLPQTSGTKRSFEESFLTEGGSSSESAATASSNKAICSTKISPADASSSTLNNDLLPVPPSTLDPNYPTFSASAAALPATNPFAVGGNTNPSAMSILSRQKAVLSRWLAILRSEPKLMEDKVEGKEEEEELTPLKLRYSLVMKAKADLKVPHLPAWHQGMLPIVRLRNGTEPVFGLLILDPSGAQAPVGLNTAVPRPLLGTFAGNSKVTLPRLNAACLQMPDVDDELLKLSFDIYDYLQLNFC